MFAAPLESAKAAWDRTIMCVKGPTPAKQPAARVPGGAVDFSDRDAVKDLDGARVTLGFESGTFWRLGRSGVLASYDPSPFRMTLLGRDAKGLLLRLHDDKWVSLVATNAAVPELVLDTYPDRNDYMIAPAALPKTMVRDEKPAAGLFYVSTAGADTRGVNLHHFQSPGYSPASPNPKGGDADAKGGDASTAAVTLVPFVAGDPKHLIVFRFA
jgi:hypothetical protein